MEDWRKLGKEELEHQYSPSHWSHRMDKDAVIEAHVKEMTEGTNLSRVVARTALDIQYGDSDSEKMDLYLPGGEPASDMDLIVAQVRRSVASIFRLYPHNTGIYLCGHSAGAQLVAMTLCTDWTEYKVTPDIKGALLVSGVYDLLPIIDTYVNDALKMSLEVALKNSPMQYVRQMNAGRCRVAIAVAEHDSPEFHRQSQQYFQSLKESGLGVSYVLVDGTDHFDVIEKLSQEDYVLTQLILKMILEQ
ncbi:kynurenine formamidase isoform X2 [Phyllobates terribilis]|uniref:kynurenine formamidase isoform X2 n=1 Tax=Phyllobates terribilis TaxID=111132 RepID=UPI003CCAFC7E